MAKTYPTPAQAIYQVLTELGHVHQKRDFALLVGTNPKNIYGYLGDPNRDKKRGFIVSTPRLLHEWTVAIRERTGVSIELHLTPDKRLQVIASGETVRGVPMPPRTVETCYHQHPEWGFGASSS